MDKKDIASILLVTLLGIIGWMGQQGLENNTRAMNRLVDVIDQIEHRLGKHDIRIENHEVRLDKGGL